VRYEPITGFSQRTRFTKRLFSIGFLVILEVSIPDLVSSQQPNVLETSIPVRLAALYRENVASIVVRGRLFNGSVDQDSGSGIRVTANQVLTNKHLLLDPRKYESIEITVQFGTNSSSARSFKATGVKTDPDRDLALLTVSLPDNTPPPVSCPIFLVSDARAVPLGTELLFMGFPLDRGLSLSSGLLSGDPEPSAREWQTNALINHGNSGGPVFSYRGYLVGLAKGGIISWDVGDHIEPVQGVNLLIPGPEIARSPLMASVRAEPASDTCLQVASMNKDGSFGFETDIHPFSPPSRLSLDNQISDAWMQANDYRSSPDGVQTSYAAIPGYRIDSCQWIPVHEQNVKTTCTVGSDRKSVTFEYQSLHGRAVNSTDGGWIRGAVNLIETLEPRS
jgi:hypothetical protein